MPTGSILRYFRTIELGTADGKAFTLKSNLLIKIALALVGRGYSVDAIDLEKGRTDALNARKKERRALDEKITVYTGSITALPFQNNSYDLIICSDVIEHIKDDAKAVSELARVLASNGTMIITVPYHSKYNERIYPMFGHERPGYNVEEMRTMLAPHHLSIVEVSSYEYAFGRILFSIFNALHFPPLMAALFYLFYIPYLLDAALKFGEPNGIGFQIRHEH